MRKSVILPGSTEVPEVPELWFKMILLFHFIQ